MIREETGFFLLKHYYVISVQNYIVKTPWEKGKDPKTEEKIVYVWKVQALKSSEWVTINKNRYKNLTVADYNQTLRDDLLFLSPDTV